MIRFGGWFAVMLALGSCRSPAERLAKPPELEIPGQGKCVVGGAASHPLVVEWAAAERASLEARLKRGLVAVRVDGCEIAVMRQCDVQGEYSYLGLTRKNDRVKIRSADELYAQLPLGAARLEGKLARAGELDVEIALVGMLEAPQGRPGRDLLTGDCDAATHIITGVQVGAFHFFAGGAGEIKVGAGFNQIGAGAGSTAERETLSADGQPASCDASTTADTKPPEGCGALIRIELSALPGLAAAQPTACPTGSRWDGQTCAMEPCPVGMSRKPDGTCVAAGGSPGPTTSPGTIGPEPTTTTPTSAPKPADDEVALCQQLCDRQLGCESEANNVAPPEGKALERYMRSCRRMCEFAVTDWNRPQMRRCMTAETCGEFTRCVQPPDPS
ncbi:hypothetical protein SAMN02745121_03382 [Nannocystis exedens]|uniref:Lipoprotein n=1 Tax=Nannocystis exedens TaxID=54 RepID=A0A1I1YLN4_9BACT|nr:hypothetical protein [Nannocystis exedens]PCC70289.1 hypothetical protein NAEX_03332 [Nannocystis exedens]SFE20456.1 hypothetical protein SAMN02745121_03382 [Nannocystis exedens]